MILCIECITEGVSCLCLITGQIYVKINDYIYTYTYNIYTHTV